MDPQSPQVNLFVWLLSMHAACGNVINPVHDGFRVFSDFLLENHVGVVCIQEVFAGDFPTLPSDQPYTCDGPIGSGGREAAFWFVQASVVLLSREWRIQPVSGGGCSTMLGASVHTMLLMQGCHRRPVSAFRGILSLLLSVCRMQSAFQWSSPETPTCGILTSTSLDPDRAMCLSSLFWICSWLLADWSCAIPLIEQPTSRALDWIASSFLQVMLWTLWCTMGCNVAQVPPVCCPVLGSDHFLCVAAGLSLPHTSRPSAWTNVAAIT